MEVASLALGIVTLAGVLKDAIDLFSMFCVARSQKEDCALLETKLDVEKVLLLYWAKDVGLDQPSFERLDERLKDEELLGHVIKIIVKIRELLNKSDTLQNEYGVRKKDDTTRDIDTPPPSCAMSGSHLAEFNVGIFRLIKSMKNISLSGDKASSEDQSGSSSYGPPSLALAPSPKAGATVATATATMATMTEPLTSMPKQRRERLSSKPSPLSKVRWVVRDKAKFENLIRDVRELRLALFDLVPRLSPSDTFAMAQQDFSRSGRSDRWNRVSLELVRDATCIDEATRRDDRQVRDIHSAAILSLEKRRYEMVLQSLKFPEMQARERNIAEAHPSTMQWALLTPETANARWDDLPKWLRAGTGIYWVRGKAGSGKSTLVKYLMHHELFKHNLDHWVPGGSCVLAGFFFWRLGNSYQNSMAGLLRSILYQLFRANLDKNLVEAILPELWEESRLVDAPPTWNPSVNEMIGVAGTLAAYNGMNKTCLVVDGLDEYVGDYNDGVRFIQALAQGPNIKLLVSSRPEPGLVDAFRDSRQLRLEDLTAGDIKHYVRHTIQSHRYTGDLIRRNPDAVKTLEDTILEKASGVFLWVVLACRSLLDGFMAADNLEELQHRLEELPGELDDMFKHMFSRIEPRYRQQGATFLKLCYRQAQQQRHEYGLVAVGLALFDDHGCDPKRMPKPTIRPYQALRDMCRMLEGRLRSRTGGLLEIQHGISPGFCREEVRSDCTHNHDRDHGDSDTETDTESETDATSNNDDGLTDTSVAFMHRLVYEHLDNDASWKMADLRTTTNVDTSLATVELHTAWQIGSLSDSWVNLGAMLEYTLAALREKDGDISVVIERFASYLESYPNFWESYASEPECNICREHWKDGAATTHLDLRLKVELGMALEVEADYRTVRDRFCQTQMAGNDRHQFSLLTHATHTPILQWLGFDSPDPRETVRCLLDCDWDAFSTSCDHHSSKTPWAEVCESLVRLSDSPFNEGEGGLFGRTFGTMLQCIRVLQVFIEETPVRLLESEVENTILEAVDKLARACVYGQGEASKKQQLTECVSGVIRGLVKQGWTRGSLSDRLGSDCPFLPDDDGPRRKRRRLE